jgi:hypothetical protein
MYKSMNSSRVFQKDVNFKKNNIIFFNYICLSPRAFGGTVKLNATIM